MCVGGGGGGEGIVLSVSSTQARLTFRMLSSTRMPVRAFSPRHTRTHAHRHTLLASKFTFGRQSFKLLASRKDRFVGEIIQNIQMALELPSWPIPKNRLIFHTGSNMRSIVNFWRRSKE